MDTTTVDVAAWEPTNIPAALALDDAVAAWARQACSMASNTAVSFEPSVASSTARRACQS